MTSLIAPLLAPALVVALAFAPLAPASAQADPGASPEVTQTPFIDIQTLTSPGGIDAWLVQDNSVPFVAIEIWIEGGGALDRPGKRGATNLMMALLEEGSGDMDAQAFAAAQEGLAASFGFDTYREDVIIEARMLSENRDAALALLRQALTQPSFPEDAIERVRQQVISGLEYDDTDPDSIAGRRFIELAYGDHPYGSALDGTPETVAALTRDDIVAAHRSALVRDRISVGVAGDIAPEELGPLLDTLLGGLPLSDQPLAPEGTYLAQGGIEVIEFPVPQASVRFGQAGLHRDDPDFFAYFVLNQILGAGGYRSRLNEEVREARGLTYGISTWASSDSAIPSINGGFSSSNALVAEAIDVVRDVWRDIAENGVSEVELAAAQRYLTGAYPLRFSGNGAIAGILAGMQAGDHTPEYINTRNDRVNAVTVEDVARVAQRILDADTLQFVVVGQPEGL